MCYRRVSELPAIVGKPKPKIKIRSSQPKLYIVPLQQVVRPPGQCIASSRRDHGAVGNAATTTATKMCLMTTCG
jgi:hypothetical protein